MRKPAFRVFDQVRHKKGCTAKEDGYSLEQVERMNYLYIENKDADQLRSYHTADLHLCFGKYKKQFSYDVAHLISSSM